MLDKGQAINSSHLTNICIFYHVQAKLHENNKEAALYHHEKKKIK